MSKEKAQNRGVIGGKKNVAEQVLNRIPQGIDTYYEPMVEGAFILFILARQKRYKPESRLDNQNGFPNAT